MFTLRDNRLCIGTRPVPFVDTPNRGGRMEPSLIVLHDTAGRLDAGSSVAWLASPRAQASAHFVIARDGTVTQMVLTDHVAWHAGKSQWRGRANVNGFSIGIELVSPGRLTGSPNLAASWFGEAYDSSHGIVAACSEACGDGLWMPYTLGQMDALSGLIAALAAAHPTITEVVGHHDIAPGRKVDPSPLMDWPRMRAALGHRRSFDVDAVSDLQQRLADLGYWSGAIDGHIGPRTRSALRDFQDANGLPVTGSPDDGTVALLGSSQAKPMATGARALITARDLRKSGSVQAFVAAVQKRGSEAFAAVVVGGAVANGSGAPVAGSPPAVVNGASTADVISKVSDVVAQAEAARGLAGRVWSLVETGAAWCTTLQGLVVGGLLALSAAAWALAHVQERARVRAARTGQHLGV